MVQPDPIGATFSALADPTRRAILMRLTQGQASVKELSEPFSISPPAITKHLRVLEDAGLIARERNAQWRPAQLKVARLREAAEWLDGYRKFWEDGVDRLDDFLVEEKRMESNHE